MTQLPITMAQLICLRHEHRNHGLLRIDIVDGFVFLTSRDRVVRVSQGGYTHYFHADVTTPGCRLTDLPVEVR